MTLRLESASTLDMVTIADVFTRGYEGYIVPIKLNEDQIRSHIERYQIDLNLSRVAYYDDELVGIGFLGRRESSGWIGGVGVAKAHRRKGIGKTMMLAIADLAREAGLTDIYLEYINGNDGAGAMYRQLGYETLRRLLIVESNQPPTLATSMSVDVIEVTLEEALAYSDKFHQKPLPWQRQVQSLRSNPPMTKGWLAQHDGETVGYVIGIVNESTFAIFDLAYAGDSSDSITALLAYIHQPEMTARLVNLGEDDPVWKIMSALGYRETMSQYEMKLMLT